MKFTGVSLIVMGGMLFLLCLVQYAQTGPPPGPLAWATGLNPVFTFAIATGSVIAGVLIIRYGGRGYDRSLSRPEGGVPPNAR